MTEGPTLPPLPSREELEACIRVLRALVPQAEAFLHRDETLSELRAEANRMIAAIQAACAGVKRERGRKKREERKTRDRAVYENTGIRMLRNGGTPAAPPPPSMKLIKCRSCYICKHDYTDVHFFYDAMCPPCAAFNYEKRIQTADLKGRTALVTGGRIKIGFYTALKLLRAGARVIVSTRFPVDAARRYSAEPDFESFRDRLQIHALDLRHIGAVHRFAEAIRASEPRLDILINNAAQTVRRPSTYYRLLVEGENQTQALPSGLVVEQDYHQGMRLQLLTDGVGQRAVSALLTQVPLVPEDLQALPVKNGEVQDTRERNSWIMGVGEVPTPELLEVHFVNAISPFILINQLLPLIRATPSRPKFIVNVSAMEGKFTDRAKRPAHAHTNMAKAALNMLTRTSAAEFAADGIYMNSVDTGWVTNEFPHPIFQRMEQVRAFQPPLDEVDGAARVVDPVFSGLNSGAPVFGHFFKDYRPTDW
jgi:NAD(P)-dependent dehydrogenase (short-subunit alcohol dehydrogenase family)